MIPIQKALFGKIADRETAVDLAIWAGYGYLWCAVLLAFFLASVRPRTDIRLSSVRDLRLLHSFQTQPYRGRSRRPFRSRKFHPLGRASIFHPTRPHVGAYYVDWNARCRGNLQTKRKVSNVWPLNSETARGRLVVSVMQKTKG